MSKETKLKIKVLDYDRGQLKITDGRAVKITTRQIIYNLVQADKIEIVMLKCVCVSKVRNRQGIITHYRVKDFNGGYRLLDKDKLKELIYNYMIDCINLTLTQDNRLIVKGIPDDDGTYDRENKTQEYRNKNITNSRDNNSNTIITSGVPVRAKQETIRAGQESSMTIGNEEKSSDTDDQQDTWDIQNWSSDYNPQNIIRTRNTKAILGISYKELDDLTKKLGLRVQA